ncbi:MAG: AAA family ATPase [Candidatus Thiodiazotropha sp. (ex Lucinoma annulata)]|nr:AAA family ATPase [Candidatus Thiodiazotropha sp. (ex Lucinoma annulata)]
MQLERLRIKNFRNLRDFEITFTGSANDTDGTEREFKSHAVIGQNGSGKSNMIEAVVTIFRDLDLNQKTAFAYELDYTCRGHRIEIKAMAEKGSVTVTEQDADKPKDFALSYLQRNAKKFLPSHVFAYYSGKNERIEALFQQHQQRFYDALISGSDELMRRLFYCRTVHSQFVLLAYLLKDDPECQKILSDLNIEDLDSVLFVLKRPYWFKSDMSDEVLTEGDNRFWYARGIVQEFLDELWKVAIAPIDHSETRLLDFRGRKEKQDLLYLFVPDKVALKKLAEKIGEPARLFKYLESTYISDLIDEVRINVKHHDVEGNINFTQLSEGEQQLLTVLGLMRFTQEDQSLFLLDEPDTHLNPIWKLRYFDEIEKVVKLQDQTAMGDSQIIVTTHDPIMVGSLKKEQVRILRKQNDGAVAVDQPDIDPQGMGFAGLLKSELFGLRSTVDTETLRRLDLRNSLFAKETRTPEEDADMSRLSDELSDLGFAKDFKDPYYELFVKQMAKHTKFHKQIVTSEEQIAQDAIADDIISKILAEEPKA